MNTEIGIWTITGESSTPTELDPADRIETEKMLEDVLVRSPNMLMAGVQLVGRQVSVGTGQIDLLGIDEEGRLVVFELKRGKLTRDAVAQILDYCSYLESLSDLEVGTIIAEHSGKHGISKIEDFDEWYASQAGDSLRPVRMVMVGLGMDVSAQRIVDFLAERGIDISLLSFHGFLHGESLFLAKQVQNVETPHTPRGIKVSASDLNRKASEYGVSTLWQDARESLTHSSGTYYTKSGITYTQPTITLPDDVRVRASHSIAIVSSGQIRITLYPAAADLGGERFEALKQKVPLTPETPPNAPRTPRAPKQWYCSLDEDSWQKNKDHLIEFARHLDGVWRKFKPPDSD